MNPLRGTVSFFSLVVRMVLSLRPLRVFMPVSLAFGLLSAFKIIYDIKAYDFHLVTSTVILVALTFQIIVLGLIADLVVSLDKS